MVDEKQSILEQFWQSITFARVASVIGLLLFGALVLGIWNNGLSNVFTEFQGWLGQAGQVNFARGLITSFVVLTTLIIALILVISLFFGDAPTRESRFSMGKEVLTIFMGILGTIMGFYYAENTVSTDKVAEFKPRQELAVIKPTINDLEKKGFGALLAKDFETASEAFADGYKLAPQFHDFDQLNRLFISQKDLFAKASNPKDETKLNEIWRLIFCEIAGNNLTQGMPDEMTIQVKANCS